MELNYKTIPQLELERLYNYVATVKPTLIQFGNPELSEHIRLTLLRCTFGYFTKGQLSRFRNTKLSIEDRCSYKRPRRCRRERFNKYPRSEKEKKRFVPRNEPRVRKFVPIKKPDGKDAAMGYVLNLAARLKPEPRKKTFLAWRDYNIDRRWEVFDAEQKRAARVGAIVTELYRVKSAHREYRDKIKLYRNQEVMFTKFSAPENGHRWTAEDYTRPLLSRNGRSIHTRLNASPVMFEASLQEDILECIVSDEKFFSENLSFL
jgi:hypothetical protein